ncbi:MAG: RNA polymerase sigma-70 factor [Prevotellaceae bacterium]|jgi:RNA polymerase sigma-70 factor (ECF subfamily)|nr:RNA polymerase sigma-70 factor [Prevotellaceae bacterium]
MIFNEKEILANIKRGKISGFRHLFDRYYVLLCSIASGYLRHKHLAEEIVDDIFFKIWENREVLNIHTSIKAYLIKAVYHRCLNYIEQSRLERKMLSDEPVGVNRKDFLDKEASTPLSDLITDELEEAISKAIHALPAECGEIFRLSRFENLKYEEIAQRKNISINTVKTQMKIALQKLREALSAYFPS